ncbi:unnamed protein product [Ceutorhynchus assimilis]|uniref:Uncharacterized protein n=1 Tax=Ceutorhynchus assimilis TaxID=467358 RepID=A0A9N9MWF2_9CUCU|nr:unnamed protein product [Ceutorhynchus assimilis]
MEDDHEELLQYTDDESVSEAEDNCYPIDKPQDRYLLPITFFPHSKSDFFFTLALLILSSISLLIVLPLYINAINLGGNVYSLTVFNVPFSTIILSVVLITMSFLSSKFKNKDLLSMPVHFWKLLQLSCVYLSCAYLYLYGSDRNRVLCHLQDPIKGIVLVFALLYYFFFCRNLMGLHRIFSTTTVIVGLFIAVDYGLCDEFVCRGFDRIKLADDAGPWSWRTHSIWTALYILSLILFAALFTLLDRHLAPEYEVMPTNIISPSFLNTISRQITASTSNEEPECQDNEPFNEAPMQKSAVHFAFWLHIFVWVLIMFTFWIDFIPGIGKGDTISESLNYTIQGIMCHFSHGLDNNSVCKNVLWYSLAFQLSYVTFVISALKFLMLSQSAVFTIASTSFALPVIGLWWTLFYASPSGALVWSPKIRGEFVCSVIGLPIVSIGLGLLCKAHFEDVRRPRSVLWRHQDA